MVKTYTASRAGEIVASRVKEPALHHRFKIQRRVNMTARNARGRHFTVGVYWRTVAEADRLVPAELILLDLHADHPRDTFRIADQPERGDIPRHIVDLTPGRR